MSLLRYFAKAKVVDLGGDRNRGATYCRGLQTSSESWHWSRAGSSMFLSFQWTPKLYNKAARVTKGVKGTLYKILSINYCPLPTFKSVWPHYRVEKYLRVHG